MAASATTRPTTTPVVASGRGMAHDERQTLTRERLLAARDETDEERRDALLASVVELNQRVAVAIARRYSGRGLSTDDLEQTACEGLVKAVQRFDVTRDQDLLDYAVPTIRGEVLRYFRDNGWAVRPPRRVQELQHRLRRVKDDLHSSTGREPTDAELIEALGVSRADHAEAASARGCFQPTSLDQPTEAGSDLSLGDLLASSNDQHGAAEARAVLASSLRGLGERQQRVIYLRFFEDRTQGEIGEEFGVTQATVSRWLRETLDQLRDSVGPLQAA